MKVKLIPCKIILQKIAGLLISRAKTSAKQPCSKYVLICPHMPKKNLCPRQPVSNLRKPVSWVPMDSYTAANATAEAQTWGDLDGLDWVGSTIPFK